MLFRKSQLNEAKSSSFDIKFNDKDYLEDVLNSCGLNISPENFCYQLTAYEHGGMIDWEKGVVSIIDDYADEEPDLSDYLEYLSEEHPDDAWTELTDETFNDLFGNLEAFDIACRASHGNFNSGDDYIRLDGYKNFETASDYTVIKEMNGDKDFILYWCKDKFSDVFDDDQFKSDILNGTNQLLSQGY